MMYHALIVDDESLVRKGLRMIFPWEKYNIQIVGEAASGEKALAFLQNQPVQLLITDITMPGMTGLELLRQAHTFDPTIKVVMLTCHQDFDYIQESLRLGAIDYIVKTQLEDHDLDEILQRIVRHMEIKPVQPIADRHYALPGRQMQEQWNQVIWVVDDSLFEAMLQSASTRITELAFDWSGVLATALEKWKQCFPSFTAWKNELFLPTSVTEVMLWVKELRAELQKWLRKSQYSEEVIYAIVKSLDLIHDSPIQQISQTDLSKKVNVSKNYFSTSFKEILGISFTHYVQWISIGMAKDMILKTNHPIYWIAEQCGFMDQRYFSKLFKEQTGTLPSELRQRQQNR